MHSGLVMLNEIERLNNNDEVFRSKLNLDRVGIMGYSFGGATAIEACIADNRFTAGINIDGWPYGMQFSSEKAISQPFMMIRSEAEDEKDNIVSELIYDKIENSAYMISINNAWHSNFGDFPLFFSLA